MQSFYIAREAGPRRTCDEGPAAHGAHPALDSYAFSQMTPYPDCLARLSYGAPEVCPVGFAGPAPGPREVESCTGPSSVIKRFRAE